MKHCCEKKEKQSLIVKAALRGCDWFVNTQTNQVKPKWDANHGRVPYNIHIPTKEIVQGLNWSMARATYCLSTAYLRTQNSTYLEVARKAMNYAKTLQILDQKNPNYGAFHEETPHSPFCYPRDGIETAGGFLVLYSITKEKDLLRRAQIYLDWYFKKAYVKAGKWGYWAKPEIRFDENAPSLTAFGAYQSGAGYILNYAYQLTKNSNYKKYCIEYAKNTLNVYYSGNIGPWLSEPQGENQKEAKHLNVNDDGQGISILAAYQLSKDRAFLKACQNVGDFYATHEIDKSDHAGICYMLNFLLEIDRVGKTNRYEKACKKLTKTILATQVKVKHSLVYGGFAGEDENPDWYVKGSKSTEYICTRTNAYAVLALFKMEGLIWGKGYSVELK